MVIREKQEDKTVIRLSPNRSASWRQTKYFLLFFAAVSLSIAFYWVSQGAWMVLPFAGLEIALLSVMMYRVSWLTYRQQIITIGNEIIHMEMGVHYPSQSWDIPKQGAVLTVAKPATPSGTVRLIIKQAGYSSEIGHFLNQTDKQLAEAAFCEAGIQIYRETGWPEETYV
ncbi:DUF2244 domain-containing protein [Marinicella sp. W31]|uniref:DUF2244 domain-containing protein n=1 Tax=Marinicella sp. W31 TaxID=3023713 RepID=UPI0037574720